MQVVHARCAGLDVHKESAYACVICLEANGKKKQEIRSFGTVTAELLKLSDWLGEHGVTHVAGEATGVYWRPVWAVLEGQFELLLVNPQHIKAVPGRKTDAQDCEWIADLLQHGDVVTRWQSIPGVDRVTACNLVVEIGVNAEQFPSAHHLASWAGLCPGNNESAGKRMSGATRDGNKWLRRALCQAAWAVTRRKDCYLSAQFKRGRPARSETGGDGRGPHHAHHRLRHAENRPQLPQARWELSGADQQGSAPAVFRETTTKARVYGLVEPAA